ncbi:hypothetical protein JX265_009523 [Neoarthrinium moseri]|uniref:Nephrocystin 3-like N-terminal domain-containing protein n=1 Tax=Neoarthrinium moseri TaxID=1658444 RepID=A0A9P9WFP8_9PEZI|nr:hypothetical protein JX265_009523 [Neoarthrinium moseri]
MARADDVPANWSPGRYRIRKLQMRCQELVNWDWNTYIAAITQPSRRRLMKQFAKHLRLLTRYQTTMARDITLQQSRDANRQINPRILDTFGDYLKFSSSRSTADAAQVIANSVVEKGEDAAEGALWSAWADLISIAEQVPHDHPAQDKLVRVVRELALLPDAGIKVWDSRLWADLPVLSAQVREWLNGPKTPENDEEKAEITRKWVNSNAFFARLNAAGVLRSEDHSIWMLRAALEEDITTTPLLVDCRIMTAAQIIEHNGPLLYQQLQAGRKLDETEERMFKGGSLFDGDSGLNAKRWEFWISRFRDLAGKTATEDVRAASLRAARLMEIWHGHPAELAIKVELPRAQPRIIWRAERHSFLMRVQHQISPSMAATSRRPGQRHGLFVLHIPSGSPNVCKVDIVALHGLNGDAFNTWSEKDGHLWLRDSLPAHVPEARILTYGYDSAVFFSSSTMTLDGFSRDLLSSLGHERRRDDSRQRPLIFICHSLGGLLFKQMLISGTLAGEEYKDLINSTQGAIFMGTPHRGSISASYASIFSRLANVATFGSGVRSDLLAALKTSSPILEQITQQSKNLLKSLSIISLYEQKPLGPSLIVEPFSAILGLPNERTIPINEDHRQIARVSPRNEHHFNVVKNAVVDLVEECILGDDEAKCKPLLDALYCYDYRSSQLRPRQPHTGTCGWLFRHEAFRKWSRSDQTSMLLLSGPPGAGKSVLARYAVEEIQSGSRDTGLVDDFKVASFFCSHDPDGSTTDETVLRSILHQLLQLLPQGQSLVRNRLEKRVNYMVTISTTTDKLWPAIVDLLGMEKMNRCVIALDAIDELATDYAISLLSGFWNVVAELKTQHPGHQILKKITGRASGMFLWAVVAWESFKKGILWNNEQVRKKLKQLDSNPAGIDDLFEEMINRVPKDVRQHMWAIFTIIAIARRPLKEMELTILLTLFLSDESPSSSTDIDLLRNVAESISQHFPEFVVIQSDGTFTFVHLSFNEYLYASWSRKHPGWLDKAHYQMAQACLDYLGLEDLVQASKVTPTEDIVLDYPLLEYSANFYLNHLQRVNHRDDIWLKYAAMGSSQSVFAVTKFTGSSLLGVPYISPLNVVALLIGSQELVRRFHENGYDIDDKWNARSGEWRAVQGCSFRLHEKKMKEMMLLLLELGANPNDPHESVSETILQSTIRSGEWDIFQIIMDNPKTDLDRQNRRGQAALHSLIPHGTDAVLEKFLENGVFDVNAQDAVGYTALHLATYMRKLSRMKKLLQVPGIRIDIIDKQGRTPLALATYWGHADAARVLIGASAASPLPEPGQLSPLICAFIQDNQGLADMLLNHCGFTGLIKHIDLSGKGVLHHAALNNWPNVINTCILNCNDGSILDQIDHSGSTALHYAAAKGNTVCCRVLKSHGASSIVQDRNGRTAAQAALDMGFKDTIAALLDYSDVDVNQRDHQGRNLVHWAASLDCLDIMQRVVGFPGADLYRRDNMSLMPVDIAFRCSSARVGRFLSEEMHRRFPSVPFTYYPWDLLYQSPVVTDVEDYWKIEDRDKDLLDREARRRQITAQEQALIYQQYPPDLWALTEQAPPESRIQAPLVTPARGGVELA